MTTAELPIERFWDGAELPVHARALVRVTQGSDGGDLHVTLDAPYHGDPPPQCAPGPTARLWEHEVVEVFIAGVGGRYLELEFGPAGHHLVLQFDGIRRVTGSGLPLDYRVLSRDGRRFTAEAYLPAAYLPPGRLRANAYAIHAAGCGGRPGRCHHAHAPVPGHQPDFHQPDQFVAMPAGLRAPGSTTG